MTPATVTVRYLIEGGPPVTTTRMLAPQSRTTVFVNGEDPALTVASVGAIVTSDVPIFAERAMYVNAGGTLGGGSASAGSPQLSTQWYFGEGATGPFFHCFLSLLNPGTTAATATVTYHLSDGSTATKAYDVPAEGRRTVYFNGEAATDPALAALANGPVWFTVSSTQPILGERAMWWWQWPWYEGHAAPGNTTSAVSWAVPEGRDGGETREQTYVLIGNTTTTAGQVRADAHPRHGRHVHAGAADWPGRTPDRQCRPALRADRGALQRDRRQPGHARGPARGGLRAVSIGERRAVLGRRGRARHPGPGGGPR